MGLSSSEIDHLSAVKPATRGASMSIATEADPDVVLPDPEPREVRYTIVSCDDHLVEPIDMFDGRLPSRFQDRAPRVIEDERGNEGWLFDGNLLTQVGMNAVAGVRKERRHMEPARFSEMNEMCSGAGRSPVS